ncbi:MAG TPA: STAS domain-containing protein [Chondromyces sp.]|nr:STAS domain-containing protein [Chondromyces sp.]
MEEKYVESELLLEKIAELTERVHELEEELRTMAVPIIPSVVPDTILVPFVGTLYSERFDRSVSNILSHVHDHNVLYVILDFTALSINDSDDMANLNAAFEKLTSSIKLMGAHVLIVGLSPQLAMKIVQIGLASIEELNCFSDFKSALTYLMKKRRLKFTSEHENASI